MSRCPSILLACAGAACLAAAASRHTPLLRMRAACGLDAAPPLENASPLVAFTTVALGGFRGLLADVLWLRVTRLQDRYRFVEIVQLADWITKLEPRSPEVWAFHAWNMAYNVAAAMAAPEDRWRWVRHGIRLLRDEGLVLNPHDPQLHWELGWLFQHKVAGVGDEAAAFYRQAWAEEVVRLLGGGRPDYGGLERDPARRAAVQGGLRLDPAAMRQVEADYGPLDWRLPEAHAVYWALRGRAAAGAAGSLPCDRMVYQNLATLLKRGRIDAAAPGAAGPLVPDPDLLPGAMRAYEEAIARHGPDAAGDAYANFLAEAARVLHPLDAARAATAFGRLRDLFPGPETAGGLEAFVRGAAAGGGGGGGDGG
jgi:hypothetical protein